MRRIPETTWFLIAIALGAFASWYDWHDAAVFATLTLSIGLSRIPGRDHQVSFLLGRLLLAFSLWAATTRLLPDLHRAVELGGWLVVLPLAAWHAWRTEPANDLPVPSYPSMMKVLLSGTMLTWGFLLVMNWLREAPYALPDTTSVWCAFVAITLAYPRAPRMAERVSPRLMALGILVAFLLVIHHFHAAEDLRNRLQISPRPLPIALMARDAGYTQLHREALAVETLRRVRDGNWADAAHLQHTHWTRNQMEHMRDAFLDLASPEQYPFFHSVAFSTRIVHPQGAEWYDLQVFPDTQTIWLMDWNGTLWKLDNNRIQTLHRSVPGAQCFHVSADQSMIAVLGERNVHLREGERWIELPLPQGQVFSDLMFSGDQERLWMLHINAEIDFYTRMGPGNWDWGGNHILPLWDETNRAVSFTRRPDGDGFLVVDQFTGAYWRRSSEDTIPFSPFQNPYRPDARDAAWLPAINALAIMDQFGRVDFASFPATDNGAATQARRSVEAILQYRQEEATWVPQSSAVAIASVPQTHSLLQLHRDGRLESIELPSGARIRYRDGLPTLRLPEQPDPQADQPDKQQ